MKPVDKIAVVGRRGEKAVAQQDRPADTRLLAFAHELADSTGAAILPYFRRRMKVENKSQDGGFDPVTAADRKAERTIRRLVAKHWPDHGVAGEEYGSTPGVSRFRWVVDPIDGTRAFLLGLPVWGTLIGLLEAEKPLLGLMDQPFTRERYWGNAGAARFRGPDRVMRRLRTRNCSTLGAAMLTTTHPDLFAPGFEQGSFLELKQRVRATRYGGDCYGYCLLAAGYVDIIIEAGLQLHDVAALIPIIEGAGGRITTWNGASALMGGRIVASGDPRLHEQALKLLNT